jgi:hypothetical protein
VNITENRFKFNSGLPGFGAGASTSTIDSFSRGYGPTVTGYRSTKLEENVKISLNNSAKWIFTIPPRIT